MLPFDWNLLSLDKTHITIPLSGSLTLPFSKFEIISTILCKSHLEFSPAICFRHPHIHNGIAQAGNRVVEVKQHYAPKISNKVAHKEQPSATERSALGFCQCHIQGISFERAVLYWSYQTFRIETTEGTPCLDLFMIS